MASFIETYLHKALPDVTYDDFNTFYGRRLDESQTLEYKSGELLLGYKGEYILNGKLDKARAHEGFIKLATSIAGLANAQGGLFVLGVKEVLVRDRTGQTIGKRPGAIYPVPDGIIQKEMIEDKLRGLIQYTIDDLIILPLRTTKRYNFETRPMVHYQISDLFGKRLAPDLDLRFQKEDSEENLLKFRIFILNQGRAVAKYVTCVCQMIDGSYELVNSDWQKFGEDEWKFAVGIHAVVYPDVPYDTLTFTFKLLENSTEKYLNLQFGLHAESMISKNFTIDIIPTLFP